MREFTIQEKSERVTIIERRIQREVLEFYSQLGKGFPMAMLSAKYAKTIQSMGLSFPEFVDNMVTKTMLQVRFLPSGAREVYPTNASIGTDNGQSGVWF